MNSRLATGAAPLLAGLDTLGDPTRLRLLRLLERHELGVAELCAALQAPQSTVSRHLKVLSDAGWVRARSEGTNRLYRMPPREDALGRRLWSVAREQTDAWPTAREDQLRLAGSPEIAAHEVGLAILAPLRRLDEVAYLRFASVYRGFESAADFESEIALMRMERAASVVEPTTAEPAPTG